jgi:hypothetical protein
MDIIPKIILSMGLGLSFWGVFKMIKAQTPNEGRQLVPPESSGYKCGRRLLILGFVLQVVGIWIN